MPEVIFIEEMPRGPTGKFSRVDLKKQFAGE
jgi:acyl-coenzyme A synthetase/AMP-(fatty) acid ligase